mgnify:CR=1 FL=1
MIEVPDSRRLPAEELAAMLTDARRRTYELTDDLTGDRQLGPKLSIVNPPLWELGHVGFFHDYFALRKLYGLDAYQIPEAEQLYDSSAIAHDPRWELPLPDRARTHEYLDRIQAAMLARLPDGGEASAEQTHIYQLTLLHEDMHGEAFFWSRQTLGDPQPAITVPDRLPSAEPSGPWPGDVQVPGGEHVLGSEADAEAPFRFDNEKPAQRLVVEPFSIARAPVTNAEFEAFIDAGGYNDPRWWSEEGWQYIQEQGVTAPRNWRDGPNGREQRLFDQWWPLAPHQPVSFVSYWEAEAWCNWAGRRLPTELEWEVAASRVPDASGRELTPGKRIYPWGDERPEARHANLDGYRLGRVDVAALPDGDSGCGCRQMLGNVWEWTSSLFRPYPGFEAGLYRDYSQPWFKEDRRVLRGGAWPTRPRLVHNMHRNFFLPGRNDLFTGFRTCAR